MKRIVRLAALFTALGFALFTVPASSFAQHYTQTNLITDATTTATASFTDPGQLLNPWGLTRSPAGPWWVSDNNSGLSTIYSGTPTSGTPALAVTIPGPNGSAPGFVSTPTGIVYNGIATENGATAFPVTAGGKSAEFIFVTEDGTISAWAGGSAATLEVDNSANPTAAEGAVYKGCTIAEYRGNLYLYVANLRSGHVEVYDTNFKPVRFFNDDDRDHDRDFRLHNEFADRFEDREIPRGFAPFNVQNIGGSLFVTYTKQDKPKHDEVTGPGLGFVDIYSPGGRLQARLDHGPWLNAPWGAVWAPRDFGTFSNRVLIGNFGSGQIAVYNGFDGKFIGLMEDPTGAPIAIDGLWALVFGNSAKSGPYNSLYFTAGPNAEADGLFGTLTPIAAELNGDSE